MVPQLVVAGIIGAGVIAADSPRTVAVVGAGIGGGAFSHYWSKAHPQDHLIAFESRDYIGGRLKHTNLHGHVVELGGDAWSTAVNKYVVDLAKEFGGQREVRTPATRLGLSDPVTASLGVWQGDHVEPLVPLVRGQPISDLRAAKLELDFVAALRKNYKQRGDSGSFSTVEEFAGIAGLDKYTSSSSQEFFSAKNPLNGRHISPKLLQFALEPLTRVIYDQNLQESHSFAGLVAVTAAVGAAQFDVGNSVLVERLFESSGAAVHLNTTVQSISFDAAQETYTLEYCNSGTCHTAAVDAVILACPVEHSNITFLPKVSVEPRKWRHWYVTVTRARGLNPEFFGMPAGAHVPYENVLTTENSSETVPFSVLQKEVDLDDGTAIWKFFSNSDLSAFLPDIFEGLSAEPTDTIVQHWPYTFPILKPIPLGGDQKYQPIVLAEKLLHLNTIESVASAMEGSIIAARNAALLLEKQLTQATTV